MRDRLLVVVATSMVYALVDVLNQFVFRALEFTQSVNWVYLPSGLRMVFVLVFIELGAVGVALGSTAVYLVHYFPDDPLTALLTGLISGLAPYLARHSCHQWLGMDLELRDITPRKLLAIASVFAVTSSVMHQWVFAWRGYSVNLAAQTAVMILGDLVGTIIVIYIAKLLILALGMRLRTRRE